MDFLKIEISSVDNYEIPGQNKNIYYPFKWKKNIPVSIPCYPLDWTLIVIK